LQPNIFFLSFYEIIKLSLASAINKSFGAIFTWSKHYLCVSVGIFYCGFEISVNFWRDS